MQLIVVIYLIMERLNHGRTLGDLLAIDALCVAALIKSYTLAPASKEGQATEIVIITIFCLRLLWLRLLWL